MKTKAISIVLVLALLLSAIPVAAADNDNPVKQPTEWLSTDLFGIGFGAIIGGALLMVPWSSGDDYTVLGHSYCVDTYSVRYGNCYEIGGFKKPGLILIGAGAALMFIGSRPVKIKNHIVHIAPTATGYGATATVKFK